MGRLLRARPRPSFETALRASSGRGATRVEDLILRSERLEDLILRSERSERLEGWAASSRVAVLRDARPSAALLRTREELLD
jgi:hypothetical protein